MTDQIAARRDMANAIRALAMDAVQQADSGHPGMPMGMADVATVLFTKFMKFDASEPHWPDRDRFILSAGHGSMLLYSLLHLTGYADMTLDELKHFRQLGSRTAGHPEHGHATGIETTTGPLGQGLGNSVGFALAERLLSEVGPSIEMPLSSNSTISRPSPRCPASVIASWPTPSIRQPSPAMT